jgi:hypothetical protein
MLSVIQGYHGGGIEVVVFWVVTVCSLVDVNQHFGARAASIFRAEFRGPRDVSTALLPM